MKHENTHKHNLNKINCLTCANIRNDFELVAFLEQIYIVA